MCVLHLYKQVGHYRREKGCLFTLSAHCLLGTERSLGGKEGLGLPRDQAGMLKWEWSCVLATERWRHCPSCNAQRARRCVRKASDTSLWLSTRGGGKKGGHPKVAVAFWPIKQPLSRSGVGKKLGGEEAKQAVRSAPRSFLLDFLDLWRIFVLCSGEMQDASSSQVCLGALTSRMKSRQMDPNTGFLPCL